MSNKAILVTGGAGYIGSHACKHLARNGYHPVTLDNLSEGHADAVKWGPLVRADVRDKGAVAEALRTHGIDTVMHFAASAYVGVSVADPLAYYDNNVAGMITLLEACRETGVGQFILSSSCATYGMPDRMPISEETGQSPVNPYGRTKLMCEQMLGDVDRAHGIRFVALRYFNAAGADPEGELTERHDPETHVIPLALMAAAGTRTHFGIFGTDYDTSDGTCIRDYIHVDDLARGHLAALRYLEDGGASVAVNLGTGKGISVRELIAGIEHYTGRKMPVKQEARRAGDPPILVADPRRAKDLLGWQAERSDLEHLIGDAAGSFGVLPA